MQAEVKAIVEQSLKKAREHDSRGNVGQAYAYFTAVVELSPENRSKVEKEFTDVLCKWFLYFLPYYIIYIYFLLFNCSIFWHLILNVWIKNVF